MARLGIRLAYAIGCVALALWSQFGMAQADRDQLLAQHRLETILGGVKHVGLAVFFDESIGAAVSEAQIRNDAELALRTHGIPLSSDPKNDQREGWSRENGVLSIEVRTATADGIRFAVHVRAQFLENSSPAKNFLPCAISAPNHVTPKEDEVSAVLDCITLYSDLVPVWSKDDLWLLGKDKLSQVRESAKDLVEAFILDYLRANEKPNEKR